jgi:surface protein
MKKFNSRYELQCAVSNYFRNNNNCGEDITNWDTSKITDMSKLFIYCRKISIQPITLNWDTSNVTNMSSMFWDCEQEFILNFNTSKVTNMSCMFHGYKYNQPFNFDTSNVITMSHMFNVAINYNQPLNFDTSKVTDMCCMFSYAINYNQPIYFNTINVTNMYGMFGGAKSYSQPTYLICNYTHNNNIFSNTPLQNQENKYLLSITQYNKLLLLYMLNNINEELPMIYCISDTILDL